MIIGNGLIASALRDREDTVFFASGVSDSRESRDSEFKREEKLLLDSLDNNRVFVYFGAIGGSELYLKHKERMKNIVTSVEKHIILNLSQVVGRGGNNNNLFNAFRRSLLEGEEITVYRDCLRSLIDVEDVISILEELTSKKKYGVYNFYGVDPLPVDLIVQLMAEALGVKACIRTTEGKYVKVENTVPFTNKKDYTKKLINKYI